MPQPYLHRLKFLGIFSLLNIYAHAEVVLDGTLGRADALNGPTFDIRADLGQQQSTNLFHSFQSFNLNEGEIATFSGPDTIRNVISRVTGGSSSTIDGTLNSTMPNADMYFLNPAGIVLGKNAQLNVPGAMHFSTADELHFSDGSTFSISQPKLAFTAATPSAFGFLSNTPAKITLTGGHLAVAEGKSLSIIGGDIELQSGSSLTAPEGRLNLASVTSRGQVVIEDNNLEVSNFSQRGLLTADQVKLEVSSNKGKGAGSIYIRGGPIELNNSQIYGKPQDEDGGVIDIVSNDLTLSQTDISVSTSGAGKSGNILINADGTVNISGLENGLFANSIGTGEGGKISITAQDLHLTEGAAIGNGAFDTGRGGEIEIKVSGTVTLSKAALIFSNSEGSGDAGTISIKADKLILSDGSQLTSSTFSAGQGGVLIIEVTDTISLEGYVVMDNDIYSSGIMTSTLAEGHAGTITLSAKHLKISQGASIESESFGEGNAGNINISASDRVTVNHAKISTEAKAAAGGNIIITVPQLLDLNNGAITTSVKGGEGGGGDIIISAPILVVLNKATVTANAVGGNGGNITINSNQFVASKQPEDSKVEASSQKALNGTIVITAPSLDLSGKVVILSSRFNTTNPLAPSCQGKQAEKANSFKVITLRGVGNAPHYFFPLQSKSNKGHHHRQK